MPIKLLEYQVSIMRIVSEENQMYINIGKKVGQKEGKIEGTIEGRNQKEIEIVKNMFKEKFSIETIQRITGVKKEKIRKIKEILEQK